MKEYAVVFEKAPNNWAAYVPDLPGCVTTVKTLEETRKLIAEAIEFHIEGMQHQVFIEGFSQIQQQTIGEFHLMGLFRQQGIAMHPLAVGGRLKIQAGKEGVCKMLGKSHRTGQRSSLVLLRD